MQTMPSSLRRIELSSGSKSPRMRPLITSSSQTALSHSLESNCGFEAPATSYDYSLRCWNFVEYGVLLRAPTLVARSELHPFRCCVCVRSVLRQPPSERRRRTVDAGQFDRGNWLPWREASARERVAPRERLPLARPFGCDTFGGHACRLSVLAKTATADLPPRLASPTP